MRVFNLQGTKAKSPNVKSRGKEKFTIFSARLKMISLKRKMK